MRYKRMCYQCEEYFDTTLKHSHVCDDCKETNHRQKILKNLFAFPTIAS